MTTSNGTFTFTPDTNLSDALYDQGFATTKDLAKALDRWLLIGDLFQNVTLADRKEYCKHAASHPEISMTASSFDNRIGDAVRLIVKYGSVKAAESAIDAYNADRKHNVYSLQNLAKALAGSGRTVKAPTAESDNDTESDESPSVGSTGDKVTSALTLYASMSADERAFFHMATAAIDDRTAAAAPATAAAV